MLHALAPVIRRRLPVVLLAGVVAVALSGCYLPVQFRADIAIGRAGLYEIAFSGQVAWVPLVQALDDRELTAAEEREKARLIERDLKRDSATKAVRYLGRGLFGLDWQRSGDLVASGMTSFLRRGERLLTLKYLRDRGLIVLQGRAISAETAQRLGAAAEAADGTIQVSTDAVVLDHNAAEVRSIDDGRARVYRWRIEDAPTAAPFLVAAVR